MNHQGKDIILIVDDQPINLKILLSFLQEQDFELRILQSGVQALALLQETIPDIILLDVMMPELDGFETCRRIKADERLVDIPIIFMTALDTVEDKVTGFKAGGVDYITKPFQQTEVLIRINTHINLRKKALKLKETQEELLLQKNKLEALINSIPDPIYIKDVDNKYIGCNRAFEETAGKPEQEIIGRGDHAVFSSKVAASFRVKDQEMLAFGEAKRTEELIIAPNGEKLFFDIRKTPYIGPDGNLLGLIGIFRNINELKRAQQEAEEERERLSVTLQSIGDGVITTDVHGKTVFINRAAEKLTGWKNADAVGKDSDEIFRIFEEKTGEKAPSPVVRVLRAGKRLALSRDAVLHPKGGTKMSIADSGAPIRDRENQVIGVVVIFRDITQEKKMEQERVKMRKLESVGVLAGGIAHDFNNLLSAILGNIELASSGVTKDSKISALLADAQKATERATKLTYQLLTFSKGGEPIKEKTSLPDLVSESANFVLHGSLVSCEFSFAEDLWMIYADSGQMSQVIQNIILNAKDAMPNGGRIRVECSNVKDLASGLLLRRHKGNFVRITLQDTGVGIPRDIIDSIFDPYFTTKKEGNGLGLAICHSIIKKHGGHITVHSESQQGTIFSIYLPALPAPKSKETEPQDQEKMVSSTKIMVMDDDLMLRNLARSQLAALGHDAVLVKDGAEAISTYQEMQESDSPIDLVILDLTIPGGMGGKETAQKLLQLDPEAKLIVASGYSNDPVMAGYNEYGFRAAVAKPFTLKELRKAIAAAH
ncbi:PAS domain S-box-containing protein [Candidatus Electrothrix aarhusensis]|jgi:PAS domain S-box-containing protein|uniref:histidine kinase n=1 Tax=Candidatus Electrothrix aarhusensis TaxID=1859131 RepID=A0A3S3QPK5_9BACT|nr:PAS domain S-box-containing protein [Candidatus Electrothrix aarhusensis]